MRKIIYYVASSIDGYISGINEDVSGFMGEGNGVDKYLTDLKNFDTVIMGRKTYEFGYKYGLKPGQPAYSHMINYIFSDNFKLENLNPQVKIKKIDLKEIDEFKRQSGSDIYLCGGGQFAGWLLDNQKIDFLKLKLNPLIIGNGTRIFGNSKKSYKLQFIENEKYDNGLQFITYKIIY